jgi:hypothetical protein
MARTATAPVTTIRPCPAQMNEARGWLKDCGYPNQPLADDQVVRLVNRNYEGGWGAFLRATAELTTV